MATFGVIENYQKEFLELINKKELEVNFLDNNFYKKIVDNNFRKNETIVNKDLILNIKKNNSRIKINKSSNVLINLNNSKENFFFIQIDISKKVVCNINFLVNSNSFVIVNLNISKYSNVFLGEFILNSKHFFLSSNLLENSKIDLIGFSKTENNSYILNSVNHIEEKSTSNVLFNSIINSNKVINDGSIKIGKNAKNSSGFLELENLVLDKNSICLSEPILEIENNNVKCSHKSSISNIKDIDKFFLKTKGFDENRIKNLVIKNIVFSPLNIVQNIEHREFLRNKISFDL